MTAPAFNPPPKPTPEPGRHNCPACNGSKVERWSFLGKPYDWPCKRCNGTGSVQAVEAA